MKRIVSILIILIFSCSTASDHGVQQHYSYAQAVSRAGVMGVGPVSCTLSALAAGMHALYSWWKSPHQRGTLSSCDIAPAFEHLDRASARLKMHEGIIEVYEQQYVLDAATQAFLTKHELLVYSYQSCVGTVMQHALHQECVQLMYETARLNLRMYQNLLADVIDAGRSCAHENALDIACVMLDWAHACIRYARAVSAGVVDGIAHTAYICTHPQELVAELSRSAHEIVCCTMRILYECGLIETLIDIDNDALLDAYITDRSVYLTTLAERIKHHAQALMQPHGVRTAVASATHMLLTGKCLQAIGKFFSYAARNAARMVQRIGEATAADTYVVASADGIFVQAAQESAQLALRAAEQQLPKAQVIRTLAAYEPPAVHIERIAKKYPQWATDNCKPLVHILKGHDVKGKLSGLHHDYGGYLEALGHIEVLEQYANGMYRVNVFYNGKKVPKTFFPKDWCPERVVSELTAKIEQVQVWVLENNRKVAEVEMYERKVNIVVELDGRIVTAYPVSGKQI